MKVLGVVVEYNPFHNGHLYHLKKAREIVEPDYTVAVMSGNFTQRGEPTIIDKFARAEIALLHGVDLVLELPFIYAVQDAGGFALGAIGIFHKMKVVTDLVFGSESSDEGFIKTIASILHEQPEDYKIFLKKRLKEGLSFPNARKYALLDYVEKTGVLDPKKVWYVERSNDILGIEYVRSIMRYGSKIEFHTVKRVGADYRDPEFQGKFSSATSIRNLLRAGNLSSARAALPDKSCSILEREFGEGRGPVFWEDLEQLVLGKFRLMNREDFENFYGFNEGLDKRFCESSRKAGTIREFVEMVKSKRFTFSRIRRLILYALFEIKREIVEKSNDLGPQYIRVLGFTEKGRRLLAKIKRISEIPVVSTPSMYRKILDSLDEERHIVDRWLYLKQFEFDVKATNLHSLLFKDEDQRKGERDFKKKVIMI